MCAPGSSLAVTRNVTVSPARASAGSTEPLRVAFFGLSLGLLSFLAGLGSSARAARGDATSISAAEASASPSRASGRGVTFGMTGCPVEGGPAGPRDLAAILLYRNPLPHIGQAAQARRRPRPNA